MNEGRNESKSTRSQLYWNILLRIPTQIINFVMSIVIARILMPKDFGILGITMMLIGYSNLFTNFGFGEAIIQKGIKEKRVLDSIFTFDLVLSLLLSAVCFASAGVIANFFRVSECELVLRVMSLIFVVTSFQAVPAAILRRDMNFRAIAVTDVSQSLIGSILTVVLALNGLGYWALVYGQLIPAMVCAVVLSVRAKWYPYLYFSNRLMRELYEFGIWNFLKTQLWFVSREVDKFMIGKWLGPVSLGLYEKSMSVAMTPINMIYININSVMFSSFSLNKLDRLKNRSSFLKAISLISLISLPVCVGMILTAPYFVKCVLGEKWVGMIVPFQIVLPGVLLKSVTSLNTSLNVAVGAYRAHTMRSLYSLAVLAVCCLLLISFGIRGIAVAFVIYCIVELLLSLRLSQKCIDLKWRDLAKATSSAFYGILAMISVCLLLSYTILRELTLINLIVMVVAGGFAYCLVIMADNSSAAKELKGDLMRDLKLRFTGSGRE